MSLILTPGYAFATTEQVTAAKLALLLSQATGSNIDQTNLASGFGTVITAASAPSNTNALWIDSSSSNTPKYWNGSAWTAIGVTATQTGITGIFRNLVSAWASNTTWTVTADELNVKDVSNNDLRLTSLNATLNSASSNGINALDTGTKANNTIYYVWVLAKADGTKGIVYSLASTFGSVTLPTGYTYGALVSVLATNNSGNFIKATQKGRKYCFATWATIASGSTTGWQAIDLTPANMTTNAGFVPPLLSNFCFGVLYSPNQTGGVTNDNSVSSTTNVAAPNRVSSGSANEFGLYWQFDVLTADTIYYVSTSANAAVYLHGFELNLIT